MATAREVEALRQRLAYDTPFWSSQCAVVRREDKVAVRLVPRPWQLEFDAALEKQRAAGQPMRAIILKARKLGFSTWVQAKFMQRVTQWEAQYAIVAAQDRKTSGVLFDMAKLMWERLPSDPQLADLIYGDGTSKGAPFSVRPQWIGGSETRADNKWMVLGDKQRKSDASVYETLTAGSGAGGRGFTPSMIHCSEVAHWEDPRFKVGLMEALPTLAETIAVMESTANGFNDFHEMWQRAVSGQEDEELGGYYVPLFFGWQDNPANSRAFPTESARDRFYQSLGDEDAGGDDEEIALLEDGVGLEQLFWRRTKKNGLEINGDIDLLHQEHPATPEQAFIGSGRPVFPGILVARAIREAEAAPKPVEGVLRGGDWIERKTRSGSVLIPRRAMWVPGDALEAVDTDRWGSQHKLKVWAHPLNDVTQAGLEVSKRRPDGQYVVAVDTARGEDGTASEGDYNAIQVFDHVTRRQVASYRSRVPIHDLPLIVYLVGLYYNEAWVAVEINNMGISVVDALAKDYRYKLLYRRHRAGDDERQDARERLMGWETTLRTKPLMEQTFGQALREGEHGLRCVLTAREFTTYVSDPKNPAKHGAQTGSHDDLAIGAMLAHRVMTELRPRDPDRKKKSTRWAAADDVTGY